MLGKHQAIEFLQFLSLLLGLNESRIALVVLNLQLASLVGEVALALELVIVYLLLLAVALAHFGARLAVEAARLEEWGLLYLLIEHQGVCAKVLKVSCRLFHENFVFFV